MSIPLMIFVCTAGALGLWLSAAFGLRLAHTGRAVVTLGGAGLFVAAVSWISYLDTRTVTTPGWDAVFFVVSLFFGMMAAVFALPVWFLLEEKFGWRAR